MNLTKPSTTEPMTVWLRKPPQESVGYPRAHLSPLCHALTGRIGTPVSATASHVRDKSQTWPHGVTWRWVIRLEHPLARRRKHVDTLLCSHCLDVALAEGHIPEPPMAVWLRVQFPKPPA